jgi:hypothetical protein
MATVQDVLEYARRLLGIAETPPGSNIVHPILDWYGEQGIQWCAATVAYIFFHVDPALVHGVKSAYSGDYLTAGRRYGEEIPAPAPGAIAIMDYGDGGITDHIGIVESVQGAYMTLIEGNHNNRVERVTRAVSGSTRFWYIMPRYSSTPKPKTRETEMALVTSGVRVPSFAGIFFVGTMGGEPWDVWAKVQNPTPTPITVRFVCVTDNTLEEETYSLQGNKLMQVQGKELKAAGNSLITIEPSVPCVCTFDHRPTQ